MGALLAAYPEAAKEKDTSRFTHEPPPACRASPGAARRSVSQLRPWLRSAMGPESEGSQRNPSL